MGEELRLEIYELTSRFRQLIVRCVPDELMQIPAFSNFPKGTCGDVSMLLGKYLIDHGYTEVQYVFGMNGLQSHGWLEIDGIIIDITADQFPEIDDPVVVTRDRYFHDRFENQRVSSADFDEHNDDFASRLGQAYKVILSKENHMKKDISIK